VVEAGRPLPQVRLACEACPKLPVDQPGHRPHAWSVVLPMMAIALTQTLIPAHASNRVLHLNPSPRKGPIEGNVFGRAVFAARFAARCRTQTLRMRLCNANIRQVANTANPVRQPREQSRLFEHGDVGCRSQHTIGHITDFATLLINGDLTLERMLL